MHELSIACGVIGVVEQAARERDFGRVLEIRLKLGEYAGIVPDCLREFFPIAAQGTAAEGAALVIETLPARFACPDCGYEGPIERRRACCPRCAGTAIRMLRGCECYVENLKVEDKGDDPPCEKPNHRPC